MKEIQLNKGYVALVDDDDYDQLKNYTWYYDCGYAVRKDKMINYIPGKKIYLHLEIMKFPNHLIDHKDRNKLNCQKDNLREATFSQNIANQDKIKKETSSKYKGVSWSKRDKQWIASIKIDYKTKYLGMSTNEEVAADMYNKGAIKYFGEFAALNVLPQKQIIDFNSLLIE